MFPRLYDNLEGSIWKLYITTGYLVFICLPKKQTQELKVMYKEGLAFGRS